MLEYIIKRLLLIIPTLFGIMLLNFLIIQAAPGGPVERTLAELRGHGGEGGMAERFTTSGGDLANTSFHSDMGAKSDIYRGSQGMDPELIARIEKMYGFDKPAHERFFMMMGRYLTFDFGQSFYRDADVMEIIAEKLPVSASLGVWSTLIIYLISLPLGIAKAVRRGSRFDVATTIAVIVGNAIPSFLFALLLIILFAGGSFWQIFPLRGISSQGAELLPWYMQLLDYAHHMVLPVLALSIGGFAALTVLTKNAFLEEMHKQYVTTATAKGGTRRYVLRNHVFRNAMLVVIAGFPEALLAMLLTGSLLIEVMFSLDGIGLLGFEAAMSRDYPVLFATLYIFALLGLLVNLASDIVKRLVDPRIDFESGKI